MQDHLADPADLAKPTEQQKWWLQNIAIQNGMRLRLEPEIADLFGHHPAKHRKAEIGAHRLCHRNPVVAGRPFHGLEPLVDHHADRLVMRRDDRVTAGVM